MINKGVLCNPKPLVFKKLDREGWVPAIRMSQDSGFVTYVFFKETDDTIGKVGNLLRTATTIEFDILKTFSSTR